MKALSIQQPWAWLIVNGYKDVENRWWSLPRNFVLPQRIYVHAGKRSEYPLTALDSWITDGLIPERQRAMCRAWLCDRGSLVGEVTITGCVTESESPWFEGPYGFLLTDPVAYEGLVPRSPQPLMRGRLGFWEVCR